jgi:hypothetical protein
VEHGINTCEMAIKYFELPASRRGPNGPLPRKTVKKAPIVKTTKKNDNKK